MSTHVFSPAYRDLEAEIRASGPQIHIDLRIGTESLRMVINPLQAIAIGKAMVAVAETIPLHALNEAQLFGDVSVSFGCRKTEAA